MLKRFKTSLFQPNKIADFNNDSKLTTFIYFILLTLLATIPYIILIFSSIGLTYDDRLSIRNELRGQEIPYEIVDYKLIKNIENEDDKLVIDLSETTKIVFTEKTAEEYKYNPFHMGTLILLTQDKVVYHTQLFEEIQINYSDYDSLKDIDFVGATNNDTKFWDVAFPIINQEMKEHAPIKRVIDFFVIFFAQVLFLILFSLLIAFFQRMKLRHIFTFGKIWQLTIYTMTPYIVLTLIGDLYSLSILSFVGIFISYFYANRLASESIKI